MYASISTDSSCFHGRTSPFWSELSQRVFSPVKLVKISCTLCFSSLMCKNIFGIIISLLYLGNQIDFLSAWFIIFFMCKSRVKKTELKSPHPKSALVRVIEKLKASQFVITQSKGRSFLYGRVWHLDLKLFIYFFLKSFIACLYSFFLSLPWFFAISLLCVIMCWMLKQLCHSY